MSRKRSYKKAFSLSDTTDNGFYLLPGCYYNPQLEGTTYEDYINDITPTFLIHEVPQCTCGGLYVADNSGNVFYNGNVGYVICEEIVCISDAQIDSDDFNDFGSDCDMKRTRNSPLTDDEELEPADVSRQTPAYIVEEPHDDVDMEPSINK